ncbi:hypothetical protein ACIPPS_18640 [Streptomyces sp. NPDC090127]|uniref:hypothetical protein n=1 Tax=Streptomyces sp. NPDC090127 TaxID=3365953 RepID=UPI00381653A7
MSRQARTHRRVTAALALLLALGACGIRGTEVVEAGDAAAVPVQPPTALRMTLFFVSADGRLLPVVREGDGVPENRPVPAATRPDGTPLTDDEQPWGARADAGKPLKVLAALMAGPTDAERAAGLRTRLPGPEHRVHELFVSADAAAPARDDGLPVFRVRYTGPVMDLQPLAVRQIVCTTVFSQHPAGLVSVLLTGPDGSLPAQSCPVTTDGPE